ncbi:MAG: hypothetical protein AB7K24_00505 [Gemmataceae bacterium]
MATSNLPREGWSPEDELAARAAEMRRWSQGLVAVGLFLLLVLAGLSVFLFKQIRKQEDVLAALQSERKAESAAAPAKADLPKHQERNVDKVDSVNVPLPPPPIEPEAKPLPMAVTPEPVPVTNLERDRHLEALGKLTGVNLYQSYLNIGLMADVVERKLYTKADVRPWLDRVATQLELIGPTVKPLLQSDEEKEDFEQCQKVANLLLATTVELKAYWDTNDKARADSYQKSRQAAWDALSELLELAPPPTPTKE